MSEISVTSPENESIMQDTLPTLSGGAMLRKAREATGLHIAALAVAMKVSVKKLEALESGRFDLLPDMVFVRALAASVCRHLKIDATPVLANLPLTTAPILKTDQSGINTPFRSGAHRTGFSFFNQLGLPHILVVLGLLVGAAVLVFYPQTHSTDVAITAHIETAPAMPVVPTQPLTISSADATSVPLPSYKNSHVESKEILTGSKLDLATLPLLPASAASTGLIFFKSRGESWVEVIDANKIVQLRKSLKTGETAAAAGALPLSVVVGRVDTTEVLVRGKSFDLSTISKDNVARFEVK